VASLEEKMNVIWMTSAGQLVIVLVGNASTFLVFIPKRLVMIIALAQLIVVTKQLVIVFL